MANVFRGGWLRQVTGDSATGPFYVIGFRLEAGGGGAEVLTVDGQTFFSSTMAANAIHAESWPNRIKCETLAATLAGAGAAVTWYIE